MSFVRVLAVASVVVFTSRFNACQRTKQPQQQPQEQTQEQPSLTFGSARISLGMTQGQVEQHLSEASRHIAHAGLGDQNMMGVFRNGELIQEGGMWFRDGRVVFAVIQMPNAKNADELAEQIANAVDNMETKACAALNFRTGTVGSPFSSLQTRFVCGSRRFEVMTMRYSGGSPEFNTTGISLGIGVPIGEPPPRK